MGTNFYIRGFRRSDDPEHHIGKRSAAGTYCWDCKITLCKNGEKAIHYGKSEWYDACPKCKKERIKESMEDSSVGRELGFNKNPPERKQGVASASSFTWGMNPVLLKEVLESSPNCPCCHREYTDTEFVVEDEYGNLYTKLGFEDVLKECPMKSTEMVGQHFF